MAGATLCFSWNCFGVVKLHTDTPQFTTRFSETISHNIHHISFAHPISDFHTIYFPPSIFHNSFHMTFYASHPTHFNSNNSYYTTNLTQLVSHNSSHTSRLTQFISNTASCAALIHPLLQGPNSHTTSHTPTIMHVFPHLVSHCCIPNKHGVTSGAIQFFVFCE